MNGNRLRAAVERAARERCKAKDALLQALDHFETKTQALVLAIDRLDRAKEQTTEGGRQ